ncbi:hypothetical protein VPZ60_004261 [Salmonella enterica]|nr:hypothetical protein [Salmonella enterica]
MNSLHTMKTMCVYLSWASTVNQTNGKPGGGKTFDWAQSVRGSRQARMRTHRQTSHR